MHLAFLYNPNINLCYNDNCSVQYINDFIDNINGIIV